MTSVTPWLMLPSISVFPFPPPPNYTRCAKGEGGGALFDFVPDAAEAASAIRQLERVVLHRHETLIR